MGGWVKLHRSLLDNGLLCHPNANALFDWLLLTATYQDMNHPTKYGIIKINRGQVVIGRKILAQKLKQTEQKIRTALELLEKQEIITIETTKHYSLITLTNYDKYQGEDEQATNEVTKPQPSLNQASTTEQEVKKDKKVKKEKQDLTADAVPLEVAIAPKVQEPHLQMRDYWHSEFEKRFKRKAAFIPAKWLVEAEKALLSQLTLSELKSRTHNCLEDGYKTNPRYVDFLKNNEDFATLRRFVIKGDPREYESKRGKMPPPPPILGDFKLPSF